MKFTIEPVTWGTHQPSLHSVRHTVFVIGQNVPPEIEVDELDPECFHFLASDDEGIPIGTARVDHEGHIGRVAVLEAWRGRGVGTALMRAAVDCVRKQDLPAALLNSQTSAAKFYERLGFVAEGEEFMEAGIPHVAMSLRFT